MATRKETITKIGASRAFVKHSHGEQPWTILQCKVPRFKRGIARLLVSSDEQDARELLATALESYGAAVTAVGTGVDALAALKSRPYDVLIADIGMADMNGYALIRTVRALATKADRRLPAIALTVYASAKEKHDALAAGYDRHIVKPLDPGRVAATVQDLLATSTSSFS
jgi:CheY-like chemotaxis protein